MKLNKKMTSIVALTVITSMMLVGCGGTSEEKPEATIDPTNMVAENDEFKYELTSVDVVEQEEGKVLEVKSNYTNLTEENNSLVWGVVVNTFQNGIQLENSMYHDCEGYENAMKELKTGATIEDNCSVFVLEDDSNVTVEISKTINTESTIDGTYEINLEDKSITRIK